MRTIHLPKVVPNALLIGSLAIGTATPAVAVEPASSVSFVNRDALTATSTNGWRNPLRANTDEQADAAAGNSLRENVTPVSYEEEVGASSNGLKTRPHTEQTGIFSSFVGSPQSYAKSQPAAAIAKGSQFRQAQARPAKPASAAQTALSMMPSFQSSAARKQSQAAAKAQAAAARAGSAGGHTTNMPAARVASSGNAPTSYGTAASAQAYRPQARSTGSTPTASRPVTTNQAVRANPNAGPLARPTINSRSTQLQSNYPQPAHLQSATASTQRMPAPSTGPSAVDPSSPAGILTQAHELAATARTEDDFSKIFALCQQVPARTATAEETAFGRQLAAWSLNRRGQLKARTGNREAAMSDFESAIRIDGNCWRALHNRGVLLAQTGQFEPAFDDFHRTIELNPGFAKAYANRGALYVLAGELEPALADYQQAAGLDPNFAVAERGCGRTCHMLGRMDEALDHLSRAIELAPRDCVALAGRADLLTDIGEYEAAAHDYEQALAINPKYADAYRGSAWLLATCPDGSVRNPGVALERAQKAVDLDRKADATTFDTLAAAQASVGEFQAAAETIRHAIEIAPPSERSVYQDRMQLYRQAKPYRIEPISSIQQAGYEQ